LAITRTIRPTETGTAHITLTIGGVRQSTVAWSARAREGWQR
jgi:hypothetical protein